MHLSTRRHCLRLATSAAHAALERILGSNATLAAYTSYVRGLLAFRGPVEWRLASILWPKELGDWRPTKIGAELRHDLSDLRAAPLCDIEMDLASDAASIMGACYVLEGSSLGAKLLFKDARRLGLTAEHGARHLAAQISSAGRWRAFIDLLERGDFDLGRMTVSANATFDAARRAMTRSASALTECS